jgi:phage I-like protein
MDTPFVMLAHAAPAADAPRRAATVVALAAGLNQAPEWIQVFPAAAGVVATQDGRSFRIRDAAAVIAASLDGERELAIDFDHAIDLAAKDGRRAPAAGWISALEVRDDGLWAKVAWTPLGQAAIANREYRFLSPVFTHSKDGEVLRVLRASLTNNPAFDMTALAQAQGHDQQETPVNEHLKKALQAAGLDPAQYTTEETALAALAELGKRPEHAVEVSALAAALGLEGQTPDGQTVLTAIAALKQGRAEGPDPSQYVDIATFKATQAQLAALQASIGQEQATAAVDAAIREGRLIPAQRDWGIAYASRDIEGFRTFAAAQPQIVGGRIAPQGEGGGAPALTPEEKVICSQLGLTEETFIAQRKREEAA